jgi:hypothetical protein
MEDSSVDRDAAEQSAMLAALAVEQTEADQAEVEEAADNEFLSWVHLQAIAQPLIQNQAGCPRAMLCMLELVSAALQPKFSDIRGDQFLPIS